MPTLTTRTDQSERLAKSLARWAYYDRRPAIVEAVDHLTRGLRILSEEGVPAADMIDLSGAALDAIANLDGELQQAMDNAGLYADPLERAELQAIHERAAARLGRE